MEAEHESRFGINVGDTNAANSATQAVDCPSYSSKGYSLNGAACVFRYPHIDSAHQATAMPQYSVEELKSLGRSCSMRLPPASAVQAMFLYEMQRQTEVEQLFQAQMFRVSRAEDVSHSIAARIEQLEREMLSVKQQVTAKDVQERLDTSKVRFNAQQAKIDACTAKLDLQEQRISSITNDLKALEAAKAAGTEPAVKESEIVADVAGLNTDVDELYTARDALVKVLTDSDERICKLEDLVRQLTLQVSISTSPSSGSPAMTQRLPVQTTNGQSIELSVPRGTGLAAGRETPSPVRSFTPGDQWIK